MIACLKKRMMLVAILLLSSCNQNNLSPIPDYTVNLPEP